MSFYSNIRQLEVSRFAQQRPILILLHGAGQDHRVWQYWIPHLTTAGWSVVAVDWPVDRVAMGKLPETELSDQELFRLDSIETFADWLMQIFLPTLPSVSGGGQENSQSIVLLGHSMGSLVALDAAARYPEKVGGLVLLGAAFPMRVSEDLLRRIDQADLTAYAMLVNWALGSAGQQKKDVSGVLLPDLLRQWWMSAPPAVLAQDLQACHRYEAGLRCAQAITCPTLLLVGDQDGLTPLKYTQTLYQHLPVNQARYEVMPGVGHHAMLEAPEFSVQRLLAWLNELIPSLN